MKYAKMYESKVAMSIQKPFDSSDKSYPLPSFAKDVWMHLQKFGMDTVFYFPDPSSKTLVDVVNNHPRFTKSFIASEIKRASEGTGHYTSCPYAIDALRDSGTYIYKSLSRPLQLRMQTCLSDPRLGSSGPVLWMALVEELQSNSYQVYKQLVREVESMSLASYNGENVADFVYQMKLKLEDLEAAKQLPPDILLTIINAFSSSSVDEFRFSFMTQRSQIETFLRESQGKDPTAIALLSNYKSPQALLDEGLSLYRSLYDGGRWGPSKAVSANTGQLTRNRNRTADTRKTSETPKNNEGSNPKSEDTNTTPKEAVTTDDGKNEWKEVPPKKGESSTKKVGTYEWHWCAKCKRWRVHHNTSTHKDLPDKGPKISGASGNLARLTANYDSDDDWGWF
jgi:hypothetical protein